jgi:hypothetical protein
MNQTIIVVLKKSREMLMNVISYLVCLFGIVSARTTIRLLESMVRLAQGIY